MTASLYVDMLQRSSYKRKLKDNIAFDDVIDYLLSKDLITEGEYLKIWNDNAENIDGLFKILKNKSPEKLTASFDIFKFVYGEKFEKLIEEVELEVMDLIHLKGGFPKINKYIPRKEKELEVKKKMEGIKWNNSLVVYGRVGEGKSYLVGECLRDPELVGKYFNNQMFWLNVGELQSKTTILQPLIRLLKIMAPKKKIIGDVDYLIEKLRLVFQTKKYRESLVIIDNARSMEVIEIFQKLRCKLIIITHFRRVKNAEFVEIDTGFTLNETVNLFAQYLETNPENLNNSFFDDIKEIHEQCKGHPSTLALLGVVLNSKKEHALASKDFWNDIKLKIDKGEVDKLGNDDAEITQRKFHEALKMCIGTIKTNEMRKLYYTFAIFPKDANISTEVLEVFWEKSSSDVTDIMMHFEDRSLVNSFYNDKKQAYVYVIHDLFLHYLKSETYKMKKEFHRRLVETYMNKYDFHELPDDNYILLFLGYHLKQADMIEHFENFLNLRFIDHKMKIVGVNNTEQDLRTYRDEIVNGSLDRKEKLDKYIKFIKDNKNELQNQQPETDIIQLALPTLKDEAEILMEENQENSINKLYFNMKLSAGRLKSSQKIFMKDVTSTAFCKDNNISKVLIGLKTGQILLYCSQTNKEIDKFVGHNDFVYNIEVSNDNSSFLSVSNDKTVKLWQFSSQRASFDGNSGVLNSPKFVQNGYIDAFSPDRINKFKNFYFDEDGSYLVSANFAYNFKETKRICTGSNDGRIILWNSFTREKLFVTAETGFPVGNVQFSKNNSILIVSKQENVQIFECGNDNKLWHCDSIRNSENIVKLFLPKNDTLIVIGLRLVLMYKLPYEDNSMCSKVYESLEHDITCSAIADGDDFFAIGIREKVLLFSVSSGKLVETLEHNQKVTSIAVDVYKVDENVTSMILMNFDDDSIQQSNIMMEHYTQPRNKQGLVTSFWKNSNLPMLALVYNETILKIQHEFTTINEVQKSEKISFITFSLCGNNLIFSLDNGEIVEYQYKRKDFKILTVLKDPVKFLQCFNLLLNKNGENDNNNSSDCDNGVIVAVSEGNEKNKIHLFIDDESEPKDLSWDFSIFRIFPMCFRQILCVDVAGGVFTVDVSKSNNKNFNAMISYATWCREVNSAAFSTNRNLVAITFKDKDSGKNLLEVTDLLKRKTIKQFYLPVGYLPKCCAFSNLGGLLAVGCEQGKIVLYDANNNYKHHILTQSESQSETPIRFIQFCNNNYPILVAVGKEISWWNLSELEKSNGNSNDLDFDLEFWKNKTVHDEIPFLLQTVNLYSNAVHFSVSKNFEKFLVVDDEGRINVMECFKNARKISGTEFVF